MSTLAVSSPQGKVAFVVTKVCSCCTIDKTICGFGKNKQSKDGLLASCKACIKIKNAEWRKRNPHRVKQDNDKKIPLRRSLNLKHKYGLTIEEYDSMYEAQQGCCAICGIHQTKLTKRLFVDHNHITGKVRQLLCTRCNAALGHSLESVDILQSCITYLNKHR